MDTSVQKTMKSAPATLGAISPPRRPCPWQDEQFWL